MIRTAGLQKAYRQAEREVRVLEGLDLEIRRGEFVAIMGSSGAGKSTLLQLLGCLDVPDAGEYWLDDREVSKLGPDNLAEVRNRSIGFVFQSAHFVDYLDLVDNVALPAEYGPSTDVDQHRARAIELLQRVGLGHRLDHRPSELSGGERQRAAVARAMFARPRLILADEPTGNLDEENTRQLVELFADLHEEGITILLVTHDSDVAAIADRCYRLRGGRLENLAA
ncbi:MAG: ABC transporter ATP-binding protein [Chromatiales bacterium]|nr:MAG: ABC transporter ATP-binding protein [Chromatiales bacterium]